MTIVRYTELKEMGIKNASEQHQWETDVSRMRDLEQKAKKWESYIASWSKEDLKSSVKKLLDTYYKEMDTIKTRWPGKEI